MDRAAGNSDELSRQNVETRRSTGLSHTDCGTVRSSWNQPNELTLRFQDHHVPELALALLVEALHLDVVGGLRLQVGDVVPVLVSLHHVLLVVAVVVAVRGPVVDVEAVDGRVVYRSVLWRDK